MKFHVACRGRGSSCTLASQQGGGGVMLKLLQLNYHSYDIHMKTHAF